MVPNLINPILVIIGLMYALQISPRYAPTILVASIAIGTAVDDSGLFYVHWQHNHKRRGNMPAAIYLALDTSGREKLTIFVIFSIDFTILILSDLINLFNFGMLIGIMVILALVADFLLAPTLMILFG